MNKEEVNGIIDNEIAYLVAVRLYDEVEKKTNVKRWNTDELWCAISYIAFIKTNQIKTIDDVCCRFDVENRGLWKNYKKIKKILNMKQCKPEQMSMVGTGCIIRRQPIDFISYAEKLNLPQNIIEKSKELINKIDNTMGRNPSLLCGGVVYLVCLMENHKIPQRVIADAFGGTEQGISKSQKWLFSKFQKEGLISDKVIKIER